VSVVHLLSLLRPLLGAVAVCCLRDASAQAWVLPLVAAAAASDWLDGRWARAVGKASDRGRLIDNLCDLSFLALVFYGFGSVHVWSHPLTGSATRYWQHANFLPLIALFLAFGSFLLRWALCRHFSQSLDPSPRGRTAGVANYVLALLGAAAVWPGLRLSPWLLEPSFVTVALLNLSATSENLALAATMIARVLRKS